MPKLQTKSFTYIYISKSNDGNSPVGTSISESVWPVKRHMELLHGILPEHAAEGILCKPLRQRPLSASIHRMFLRGLIIRQQEWYRRGFPLSLDPLGKRQSFFAFMDIYTATIFARRKK